MCEQATQPVGNLVEEYNPPPFPIPLKLKQQ